MTFLSICQDVHREIAGGSGDPGTLPTAVTGQVGELARIVKWVQRAYREIQESQRDWRWMITESTNNTLALGASSVTLTGTATDYDELRPYFGHHGAFVLFYKSSIGVTDAQETPFVPWAEFNGFYNSGRFTETGRPQFCALAPDGTLKVHPVADVQYNVKYAYRKDPQELSADGDVPLMPAKYHDLIMYLALCYYGRSNEANRILSWLGTGLQDRSRPNSPLTYLYQALCNEQLPAISYFGES